MTRLLQKNWGRGGEENNNQHAIFLKEPKKKMYIARNLESVEFKICM